MVYKLLIL